jgi:hypothetical protein
MKNVSCYIIGSLLMVGLQSCFVFKNGPASAPLEGRYKKLLNPAAMDNGKAPISVNVVSSINPDPADTTKPKTIMNLQGQGQRELISEYAKIYKKPGDFKDALNTVYFKKKDDGGLADFSSKSISITISVAKIWPQALTAADLALGDRLEMITMKFKLDDSLQGVYFKSWDRFKTQYGRFFIGSRSFTGNQELNINPSITLANAAALSLGNYDTKSQYTEQDTLSQQVIVSNGVLNEKDFMVDQTGTPKTSLLGNTILNITIGTKTPVPGTFFSFDTLFAGSKIAASSKVKMTLKKYLVSDNSKPITGTLTCAYRYRHITNGDRTYGESDDTVQYEYGTITQPVKLVEEKDLMPKYWYIHDSINNVNLEVKDILNTSVKNYDLDFASNDEAVDFLGWLIHMTTPPVKKASGKKSKRIATAILPPDDIVFNGRYKLVVKQTVGGKPVSTPITIGYTTNGLTVRANN